MSLKLTYLQFIVKCKYNVNHFRDTSQLELLIIWQRILVKGTRSILSSSRLSIERPLSVTDVVTFDGRLSRLWIGLGIGYIWSHVTCKLTCPSYITSNYTLTCLWYRNPLRLASRAISLVLAALILVTQKRLFTCTCEDTSPSTEQMANAQVTNRDVNLILGNLQLGLLLSH